MLRTNQQLYTRAFVVRAVVGDRQTERTELRLSAAGAADHYSACTEKRRRKQRMWTGIQPFAGTDLEQPSPLEHSDSVGQRTRFLLLISNKDRGSAETVVTLSCTREHTG